MTTNPMNDTRFKRKIPGLLAGALLMAASAGAMAECYTAPFAQGYTMIVNGEKGFAVSYTTTDTFLAAAQAALCKAVDLGMTNPYQPTSFAADFVSANQGGLTTLSRSTDMLTQADIAAIKTVMPSVTTESLIQAGVPIEGIQSQAPAATTPGTASSTTTTTPVAAPTPTPNTSGGTTTPTTAVTSTQPPSTAKADPTIGVHVGLNEEDIPFTHVTGLHSTPEMYLYGKEYGDNTNDNNVFNKVNTIKRNELVATRTMVDGASGNVKSYIQAQKTDISKFTTGVMTDAREKPCGSGWYSDPKEVSIKCAQRINGCLICSGLMSQNQITCPNCNQ